MDSVTRRQKMDPQSESALIFHQKYVSPKQRWMWEAKNRLGLVESTLHVFIYKSVSDLYVTII